MLDHLRGASLLSWMIHHLYPALFVATFIEGLGIPVPAELLYGVTGMKIHAGFMRFPLVVLVGTMGNVLGSLTAYGAALWGGRAAFRRLEAWGGIAGGAEERAQAFFKRWGGLAISLCRFVGVIRAATILGAGLTRIPVWRFVLYLTLGALTWNWLWAYVGLIFGHAVEPIMKRAGRWILLVFLALAIAMLMRAGWHWWKGRRSIPKP